MSNNKQPVELTEITASLPVTTQGLTMEDRDAYYVDESVEMSIGFLLDCAKIGQNRGKQRPSICKVSRILRDLSIISFVPQLVSIGPIHRENHRLHEFEWLKEIYLNDLLNRCHDSPPKKTLEACLQKIKTKIPEIRESYAGVRNYSDVELATMMVMDGCFILEFCFKHDDDHSHLPNKIENKRIAMDLMLLENQVPFFVLQALFDCSMGEAPFTLSNLLDAHLAPYIQLFFSIMPEKKSILSNVLDKLFRSHELPGEIPTTDVGSDSTHDHVLGYLHKRYQLVVAKSSEPIHAEASKLQDLEGINNLYTTFYSIVELDRSGMKFKHHLEDVWSMTIKFQSSLFARLSRFWSKPTLLMPTLVIGDFTELILRNFIAYEQLFPQDHYYFTSYAVAMDMLIHTREDIAKLVESKVLVNTLGSNQEAADMINNICKNTVVTDFCYIQAFKQMYMYRNRFLPKYTAWLRRDFARAKRAYLNNSWKAIAVLGALILFGLTVVQTVFAIIAR